jgi:hypothetical protein
VERLSKAINLVAGFFARSGSSQRTANAQQRSRLAMVRMRENRLMNGDSVVINFSSQGI